MSNELTLDNISKLLDTKFSEFKITIDSKFEALTELMLKNFDDVYFRLDKIEFNTSGQERRISTLEDKVRIISTRIGLDPKTNR